MSDGIALPAVFSDHAVLQRGKPIPVWGWCSPDVCVTVKLNDVCAETRSSSDGRFILRIPPQSAGGPYELTVRADRSEKRVSDVMIGEVWLASGQSNMEMVVASCGRQGEETMRAAAESKVRMLTVGRTAHFGPQRDIQGEWQTASPDTLGAFSGVAFHFAETIQKKLDVPVGILHASWGGTIVETWTSREALIENPQTRVWTERYEASMHAPGGAVHDPQAYRAQNFPRDPGTERPQDWAGVSCDDSAWATMDVPRHWQTEGHDFSGVFWFRLNVSVPAGWKGMDLKLKPGAIDKIDVTYFNGSQVGATGKGHEETHWNVVREYTVPGHLVKEGKNVIAVRVFSFVHGGGLVGPALAMTLEPADGSADPISLAGEWLYAIEHNLGKTLLPGSQSVPMGPGNPNSPYMLYNNMIQPLIPYAIGGVIWYQGESNTDNAANYRGMLTALIRDWRRNWGQGMFPFLFVQLANFTDRLEYQNSSTWARLREAQLQTLSEPETGMAVAIDAGDAIDIHPQDKRTVGERLARWALAKHFGFAGSASGPLYKGMTIEASRIRVHFENASGGLTAKDGKVSHVYIAGTGRRFVPASAWIEGSTLLAESPEVDHPVAVRYAWADNPEGCNLENLEGLPASPFRTDSW